MARDPAINPPDASVLRVRKLSCEHRGMLRESRWHTYFHGLSAVERCFLHLRIEYLQSVRPFIGVKLQNRCTGVKSMIIQGLIGNRAWARSMMRKRTYREQQRRGHQLIGPRQRIGFDRLRQEAGLPKK